VIEPICDAKGVVTATFGINLDNTEYVEAEEALRMSLTAAEAATRAKSEFLATMSHEIRTPLNGVIGMIDLLLGSGLPAHQQEMARTIHDSGATLLGIVNDILDYSKIEAGKLELEQQPYDPARVIGDVVALLKPQALSKQLALEFTKAAAVPQALLGDAGRVRQVLFNVVGNALKFTARGTVRINLDQNERFCILTVQDSGIGIAAEDLGKLFRRFSQVDASMTRRFGGTGLGLAICQRLVEAMAGTITVTSVMGEGSTFIISLPLPAHPLSAPTPRVTADAMAPARALRVLLAEDNLVNQKVASGMLTRLGHQFEIAGTGVAAVAAWRRGGFDLILMDMQMPEMDGLEATRLIRSEESTSHRIPILALTANALESDRAACFAAGMVGVVAKPVTSASLAQALREFGPA
jgi:CheY-like chemotaxis protein